MLQSNLHRDDVLFYYTTTGWMMWNWLVGGLSVGATIVLYDGSPFQPHHYSLWELADQIGITVFGTSAKWLAVCMDQKLRPKKTCDLSTVRAILSTGLCVMRTERSFLGARYASAGMNDSLLPCARLCSSPALFPDCEYLRLAAHARDL